MERLSPLFLLLAVLFLSFARSVAQPDLPKLEQRVTDFTNTMSYTEWNFLETRLKNFEDTTSMQIVILFVSSVGDGSIEEYANKVFEKNGIGQKNKNNGALVVVAKSDRLVSIEVGYGLEGSLTDAICSQIIEKEMKPMFREENYFAGLANGVSAIIKATAGEYSADSKGREAPVIAGVLVLVFVAVFFVFLLPRIVSRRRYVIGRKGWMYYPGWGYSSRGGGGSSSGGFGGWSGGGGMSGGGGATGKW